MIVDKNCTNSSLPKDEYTRLAKRLKLDIYTDISNHYGYVNVVMLLDKAAFVDTRFRECVTEIIQEIVYRIMLNIVDSDSSHSPELLIVSNCLQ